MNRREWILNQISDRDRVLEVGSEDGWLWGGTPFDVTLCDCDVYQTGKPFIKADAHCLPFADGSFDVVVLAEVLEHVYNPLTVLKRSNKSMP